MLPDLDSNQDKQYQKLSYYHYTIGQTIPVYRNAANVRLDENNAKCYLVFVAGRREYVVVWQIAIVSW